MEKACWTDLAPKPRKTLIPNTFPGYCKDVFGTDIIIWYTAFINCNLPSSIQQEQPILMQMNSVHWGREGTHEGRKKIVYNKKLTRAVASRATKSKFRLFHLRISVVVYLPTIVFSSCWKEIGPRCLKRSPPLIWKIERVLFGRLLSLKENWKCIWTIERTLGSYIGSSPKGNVFGHSFTSCSPICRQCWDL